MLWTVLGRETGRRKIWPKRQLLNSKPLPPSMPLSSMNRSRERGALRQLRERRFCIIHLTILGDAFLSECPGSLLSSVCSAGEAIATHCSPHVWEGVVGGRACGSSTIVCIPWIHWVQMRSSERGSSWLPLSRHHFMLSPTSLPAQSLF